MNNHEKEATTALSEGSLEFWRRFYTLKWEAPAAYWGTRIQHDLVPDEMTVYGPAYQPEGGTEEGADVLNIENRTERAKRLEKAIKAGEITMSVAINDSKLCPGDDLVGQMVLIHAKLHHTNSHGTHEPGEFDGWFIGEKPLGGHNPILLIDPERVIPARAA